MSHFLLDSTIFNLFKSFTIILLLEYLVKGLEVEQGSQFSLTCSQSTKLDDHSLSLNLIEMGEPLRCLYYCKDTKNAHCEGKGISGISCGSRDCHDQPQCNFTFAFPSIRLDGVKVGCYDKNEHVKEWDIKGFDFLYVLVFEFVKR